MAKNTIYVTGHKNPDTDSIICAMAYAYLKQELGFDAVAVRIGEINQETEYILNLFNEFAPPLVSDIKTRVRDIDFDDVITCYPDTNISTALAMMKEHNKKVIAIVDEKNHLAGMATISDIIKPIIDSDMHTSELIKDISIEDIVTFLNGKLIYKCQPQHSNGEIIIGLSRKGLEGNCEDHIVITADNTEIQRFAIENKAATLIIAESNAVSYEILTLAKQKQCNVIVCQQGAYEIADRIYYATPIKKLMSSKLTVFKCDDYVDDVKQVINKSRFRSYPVLDSLNHIVGTLSRYHVFKHSNRNLILVDHNELAQSIDGAAEANIMEIIDHHRLGGMKTAAPIYFRNEHVGCCATIVTSIFKEKHVEIPEDLAGLLCCAIISDTVNFHSVTCTQRDIDTARELAKIGHLDLEELGPRILAAGAKLSNRSVHAIFHNDLKIFTVNRLKVAVSQSNVVNFDAILGIRDEMNKLLANYVMDSGCNIVMMVFSLIDGTGSYVLVQGNEVKKISDALNKNGFVVDGFTFLPNVISRKQQIIPMVTEAIEEAR